MSTFRTIRLIGTSAEYVFTVALSQETNEVVAICNEIDIASDGKTEMEALQNIAEAIALYLSIENFKLIL